MNFELLLKTSPRKWVAIAVLPVAAVLSFFALSTSGTPPNISTIALSSDPLYAPTVSDKAAIALAMSVEFPTVGAQYVQTPQSTNDNSYLNTNEYLGYYDAESCYSYIDQPTETPATGFTASDYKRFKISGPATNRMCDDAFSGNFLNWASSSAIDMLRLAITGGDRYIDTSNLTILQRAMIPDGDPISMWNSSNFPGKQLLRAGGTSGKNYFGAIPLAMATAAGTNDVWVANTLNRIYFGTSKTGTNSGSAGSYTLGASTGGSGLGPVTSSSNSLPGGSTLCASENGTCNGFTGTKEIWYGADTRWKVAPASGSVGCNNNVFGDPAVGTPKSCYYRNYTGSWTPTSGTSGLNSDGFFYARAQVCDTPTSGNPVDTRYWGLCLKYPAGNFKPVGTVQRYSDSVRLAAFGYLLDQTQSSNNGRYGGVLRAPMKYVGFKTFDENGVENTPSTGNPLAEWNVQTGIFNPNPQSADTTTTPDSGSPTGISGVVNYVNKFGRTNTANPGRYKTYDPVGELHYEALRYLQGLQPTPAAVSSIDTNMFDGFPAYSKWTDPYANRSSTADYSCAKSNIVVVGDINTWDGNRLPSPSASNNIPDINKWRTVVQNFEKNNSSGTYVDSSGNTRKTTGRPGTANNSVPSATDRSQIMGSAYWARSQDIRGTAWTNSKYNASNGTWSAGTDGQRPGLRVKTLIFDVNEYAEQNVDSNRLYANQFFMAAKYGGYETDPSNLTNNPYNTWGNPFLQSCKGNAADVGTTTLTCPDGTKLSPNLLGLGTNKDYIWADTDSKTSRVGEANTYFRASGDARAILSAFDDIFKRAATAANSIAGGAIQSKNLTQGADTIYQGAFDTSDWSGDLNAYSVSLNTSNAIVIGTTPVWQAAKVLTARDISASPRNIVVGDPGASGDKVAVAFKYSELSSSLKTAMDKPSPISAVDGNSEARVNYILGDRSKEGNPFRKRNSLMGDVINGGVVFSGDPVTDYNTTAYQSFLNGYKGRTQAVFVGANDGMMHAFNGKTGDELFAYIPSWVAPKLPALTNVNYTTNHTSFVDGTPVVAEAELSTDSWATVLVSGTGAGGKGVFALDVTDPTKFDSSKVLWEFKSSDDADMGYVVGRPKIIKVRTSSSSEKTATYEWFAVVASGVNNYVADTSQNFSTTGKPALFFLKLGKKSSDAWALGTNYFKISLPVDTSVVSVANGGTGKAKASGLINFTPVLDGANVLSKIYMGDLQGNLWKLDFSTYGTASWTLANLSPYSNTSGPIPMYIAKDGTSSQNIQPISSAPQIKLGVQAGTAYVLFGTGKYLEVSDKSSQSIQSQYMIYDDGTATLDGGTNASAISDRTYLQAASSVSSGVVTIPSFTVGRAMTASSTTRSGWYFDMAAGERQVSNGTVFGNSVVFGTLVPGVNSNSSCATTVGGGNLYSVNIAKGSGSFTSSTVGILGEPLLVTIAVNYSAPDSTGRKNKVIVKGILLQGSGGLSVATGGPADPNCPSGTPAGATCTPVIAGRLSWRQINNYQDLKNN